MITRRFFCLFDLLTLSLAFLGAYALAPRVQLLVAPGGILRLPWLEVSFAPTGRLDWSISAVEGLALDSPNAGAGYTPVYGSVWQYLSYERPRLVVECL